ncbi:hypothetical protein PspLS_07953 [Pyricularia sp. CBS 133598]|nr:hypothetical protein PspLS_07953 [Pyricularia sp. CBS 133598]
MNRLPSCTIPFEPGKGCQVCRKLMTETKCPQDICGKLACSESGICKSCRHNEIDCSHNTDKWGKDRVNYQDPIAEMSAALEKSVLALLDTLDGVELLKSTNSANPEIAAVIEGLEEKAKSSREVFENACDSWLEAWDTAEENGKDNAPVHASLSEMVETCLLQLLPDSPEARLYAANMLLCRGATHGNFPGTVMHMLDEVRQEAQEEVDHTLYF